MLLLQALLLRVLLLQVMLLLHVLLLQALLLHVLLLQVLLLQMLLLKQGEEIDGVFSSSRLSFFAFGFLSVSHWQVVFSSAFEKKLLPLFLLLLL